MKRNLAALMAALICLSFFACGYNKNHSGEQECNVGIEDQDYDAEDYSEDYDESYVEDYVEDYVDLGLPSGTLWATRNIGASKPEEYGDYFAWGEIQGYNDGKSEFSDSTYKYFVEKDHFYSSYNYLDDKDELDAEDDAATAKLGAEWQIPSTAQMRELIDSRYTTQEWTAINGVYGLMITSDTNGNSIFLPAAGIRRGTELYYTDSYESEGYYWSRRCWCQIAYDLEISSEHCYVTKDSRDDGKSIRPVRKK